MANDTWIHPFLRALAECGVVAAACRAAGVASGVAYKLRQTDPGFKVLWDEALEDATDAMEIEARRRAMDGVEEPIVHKGEFTPAWERDAKGQLVMRPVDTGMTNVDGEPIMDMRPVQAVDEHGNPRFLTVNKKSDPMLMFLLKGNRAKFSTERTEITGRDGEPLQVNDTSKRAARIAALLELAAKRQPSDIDDLL